MSRYVELSREKVETFLRACGFRARKQGSELLYVRPHKYCEDVFIKVYTSFPYEAGKDARGKCEDAIRVTCAYESQIPFRGKTSIGLFKATRTFRTGSEDAIVDRLYERMREAYQAGTDWLNKNWVELQAARKAAERLERKHR